MHWMLAWKRTSLHDWLHLCVLFRQKWCVINCWQSAWYSSLQPVTSSAVCLISSNPLIAEKKGTVGNGKKYICARLHSVKKLRKILVVWKKYSSIYSATTSACWLTRRRVITNKLRDKEHRRNIKIACDGEILFRKLFRTCFNSGNNYNTVDIVEVSKRQGKQVTTFCHE